MNKFDEIYNKIILEARRRDLEYAEKKDKKTGALKEVLVEVEGIDSGVITKQINIIKEAKEKADEAAKIYEEHKERVIEYMPDFFDEADKFATRIIKTKSGVIKFHKFIEAGVKVEESTDVDSVRALLKDLMDLNIKSPENDLENLTYDQIMSAQYEDMNIDSSEKMAYTIGRFIKEGKGVAACKYFLEYVDNDDIEYAKTYIYSIYDIITFKKQSTFEIMALNLIELKCLGQTDVAVNEFCKYAVCDIQTAIQAVDLL